MKRRNKVLTQEVSEFLEKVNLNVAKKFGVRIIEQKTYLDCIHVVFVSKPQIQLSKFVNSMKSVSARLILTRFLEMRKQFCDGHLWSPSYFLVTMGEVRMKDVESYIQSQGEA